MWKKPFVIWHRILNDDDGVTLVEYGIALMLALSVGTVLLLELGGAVESTVVSATSTLTR